MPDARARRSGRTVPSSCSRTLGAAMRCGDGGRLCVGQDGPAFEASPARLETLALWQRGRLDERRVVAICDTTDYLGAEKARAVQQRVLDRAPDQTLGQLKLHHRSESPSDRPASRPAPTYERHARSTGSDQSAARTAVRWGSQRRIPSRIRNSSGHNRPRLRRTTVPGAAIAQEIARRCTAMCFPGIVGCLQLRDQRSVRSSR